MLVYSGRFLTTTPHGQTLASRPGKAGGLPYVLVIVIPESSHGLSSGCHCWLVQQCNSSRKENENTAGQASSGTQIIVQLDLCKTVKIVLGRKNLKSIVRVPSR